MKTKMIKSAERKNLNGFKKSAFEFLETAKMNIIRSELNSIKSNLLINNSIKEGKKVSFDIDVIGPSEPGWKDFLKQAEKAGLKYRYNDSEGILYVTGDSDKAMKWLDDTGYADGAEDARFYVLGENRKVIKEAVSDKALIIGKTYYCGYRKNTWSAKFLGYGNDYEKVNSSYKTINDVYKDYNVSNLSDLEKASKEKRIFQIWSDDGDEYSVYLYNGKWCVGTSADIHKVNE